MEQMYLLKGANATVSQSGLGKLRHQVAKQDKATLRESLNFPTATETLDSDPDCMKRWEGKEGGREVGREDGKEGGNLEFQQIFFL